jgi:hypothetical protein
MIIESGVQPVVAAGGAKIHSSSYVEWSAVLAGAVLASAISVVLLQFGSAIGLAATSPFDANRTLTPGGLLAIGLWTLWIQVTASFAGGYLAGRMRAPVSVVHDHEREVRDGMHGLMVWATGTVAVALVIAAGSAFTTLVAAHTGTTASTSEMTPNQHNTAVIFAFVAGAVSFVSAAASWWSATMGGEHRDKNVDHSRYLSFKR